MNKKVLTWMKVLTWIIVIAILAVFVVAYMVHPLHHPGDGVMKMEQLL